MENKLYGKFPNEPNEKEKLPSSFWYFLTIVAIIAGAVVWNCTHKKSYPGESRIKDSIVERAADRDTIIQDVRKSSSKAAKKSDSIIKTLQTEPWRLEEKDLEDSLVREYLRNYKYQ